MEKRIIRRCLCCLAGLCLLLSGARGEEMTAEQIREILDETGVPYSEEIKVVPSFAPAAVPRIRTERIRFDRKRTKELTEQYGLPRKKGESWICEIHGWLNPDYELLFEEEEGLYGSIAYDVYDPPVPLDESDEGLCRAAETVRAFLDGLGLEYEYPFYRVVPYKGYRDREINGVELTVRFPLEGIPCNTTIGWTKDSDGSGNGDPTPGAFFIATRDGKLTTAVIRNPVTVTGTEEDPAPLKNWDEILRDSREEFIDFREDEYGKYILKLKYVQLVMMVDPHREAYPAWAYTFDCRGVPGDGGYRGGSYDLMLTYNARTGRRVWCYP